MGGGEPEKVEAVAPQAPEEAKADQEKADDSKAPVLVDDPADKAKGPPGEVANPPEEKKKPSGDPVGRDVALARVVSEKKLSLIKAWEENERAKAENKAKKKLAAVTSWEEMKKADVEVELKKMEGLLKKKKAEYAEKMENKIAEIHKVAEENRAIIEAKQGEDLLKAEEIAAKYRAKGFIPRKILACFSG